ncbi:hypothetical protein F5Y00DRAFT_11030 [Daldinia vernicosa]|uniref:uncharacterized protein n=1 Tax=Daldinia vernicosa TaxID=114800 RepID=UPI0020080BC8|nr:uncharacterized protein F5Y00DRAFT_11030 [Daldinia vernicosa]KAI0851507.1 hypothetical protein F5Y00DRAFT_11030 [Daldinia vernicosa]
MTIWKCKLYFVFLMSLSLSSGDGLPLEIYVHPVIPAWGSRFPARFLFFFFFQSWQGLTIISCFLFLFSFFPLQSCLLKSTPPHLPCTSLVA